MKGRAAAWDGGASKGGNAVKRFLLMVAVTAMGAMIMAAGAFAQTVPAIPVDAYGSSLLSALANAVQDVLPWVAAVTAFAIGIGLIFRWLGRRTATSVGR